MSSQIGLFRLRPLAALGWERLSIRNDEGDQKRDIQFRIEITPKVTTIKEYLLIN